MIERGVRFVLLVPPTAPGANRWDQHENLREDHRDNARHVDRPIAGLLQDLNGRGLLDETLVVWGGEFGRTPTSEENGGKEVGRDHNPYGFSMWLAGGGIRPGIQYGATDEFGFRAIDRPTTVHDLHATILHLLGIDHTALTFQHGGRDHRLTDVFGEVVSGLLA
jgi:arylsulfatase A-like enzyme